VIGSTDDCFLREEHKTVVVQRVMMPFHLCGWRVEKQRRVLGTVHMTMSSRQTAVKCTDSSYKCTSEATTAKNLAEKLPIF